MHKPCHDKDTGSNMRKCQMEMVECNHVSEGQTILQLEIPILNRKQVT